MGWGRYLLLGDLGQQLDVEELRREVRGLRAQASRDLPRRASRTVDARAELASLQREHDELRLYVAVLVRHLLRKRILLQTELEALVSEIDAEDGSGDGGHRGPIS